MKEAPGAGVQAALLSSRECSLKEEVALLVWGHESEGAAPCLGAAWTEQNFAVCDHHRPLKLEAIWIFVSVLFRFALYLCIFVLFLRL